MTSKEAVESAGGFYVLSDALIHGAFRGTTDDLTYADLLGASRGHPPLQLRSLVKQSMGHKLLDFVWVSLVPLVSDRVVAALSDMGATGWSTYDVDLRTKSGKMLCGYRGLSVVGRCESFFLDAKHSQLVYSEYPKGWGPKYRGLWFDVETWDGSDLFTCLDDKTMYTVVTHRVVSDLIRKKLTNMKLRPLSKVEVDATDLPMILYSEKE